MIIRNIVESRRKGEYGLNTKWVHFKGRESRRYEVSMMQYNTTRETRTEHHKRKINVLERYQTEQRYLSIWLSSGRAVDKEVEEGTEEYECTKRDI